MCAYNKRGSKSRLFLWKYAQFIKPVHIELEWVKKKTKKATSRRSRDPFSTQSDHFTYIHTHRNDQDECNELAFIIIALLYIRRNYFLHQHTSEIGEKFLMWKHQHIAVFYNNISRVFHELLRGRLKYYCVIIIKRQLMWDTRNFLKTYFS